MNMLLIVAQMSRGSYLYQLRLADSKQLASKYASEIESIKEIYQSSKDRYGYRRVGMMLATLVN